MSITKWRKAKVGDYGLIRVTDDPEAGWLLLSERAVIKDDNGEYKAEGETWQYCEILVVHIAKETLNPLANYLAIRCERFGAVAYFTRLIEEAITTFFKGE